MGQEFAVGFTSILMRIWRLSGDTTRHSYGISLEIYPEILSAFFVENSAMVFGFSPSLADLPGKHVGFPYGKLLGTTSGLVDDEWIY